MDMRPATRPEESSHRMLLKPFFEPEQPSAMLTRGS